MNIHIHNFDGEQSFACEGGELTLELSSEFNLSYRYRCEEFSFKNYGFLVPGRHCNGRYEPDYSEAARQIQRHIQGLNRLYSEFCVD